MAKTGRPPFRADHVGSLLRPPELRQAFRDHAGKRIDNARFAQIQDEAIRAVVARQEEAGLKIVTDGEFRRGSYWSRFVERVDGFTIKPAVFKFQNDAGDEVEFTAPYAAGKLARRQPLALDEFTFLKGIAQVAAKITLPSPSTMHFYRCSDFADRAVYADTDSFFADLAALFRAEIADLVAAGCRYVQLDEVAIALLCDPAIRDKTRAAGLDPDHLIDLYIDVINDAVRGLPDDVVIGVHVCRGNFKGHYLASGGYDSVAEKFFGRTAVNHFLLEYDTDRAGDFAPLRFVKGKGVVLGLISSKTPALEDATALKRRIEEASRVVDLDRLALGPQCGFASTVAGNPVTEADQWAKLRLAVEVADEVWKA